MYVYIFAYVYIDARISFSISFHPVLQNKHAAQRAMLRNGDQLSSSCMVGVKPLDAAKLESLEKHEAAAPRVPTLPKLAASRPYQVSASTSQTLVVPLASKSAWEKISEFILGI